MKWVIRIGLVVVLLVVVLAVGAFIMIDSIATAAVKEGAAFATQTEADCEKVDVKIFGSSATISNLDIKNPDGPFREKFDSFLKLGNGSAEVSAGSVMSDMIEIPKVELSDIEISLVGLDDGTKNYEKILEALKRFQGDAPPKETEDQKQVVIKELIISNITVKYDFAKDPAIGALPAKGTVVIADDKPMVLTDVGSGGVPMSQITADIIADVLVQVTANLAGDLGGHVKGLAGSLIDTIGENEFTRTLGELDLGEGAAKLKDLGVDLGEGATKLIEGLGEGAGDVGDKIKEGLGGVLGGDKDKQDKDKDDEEGGGLLDDINPF